MKELITEKKHIPSLNLLRGIAALSVCLFHVFARGTYDGYPLLKAICLRGYLGLDLFFIISGFIIPYSMYQNKYSFSRFPKFMLKRSCRIEPPYIASFLLVIAMRLIYTYTHGGHYVHDWKQFWLHFFYLNQYFGYDSYIDVYWTLAIEFQFYLLVGFLFPLISATKKFAPLTLFFTFSILSWFLNLHYNWFIFQYGFLFLSGVIIFLYKIRHISADAFFVLLGSVLIAMFFKDGPEMAITTVLATTAILLINREWKVSNFLGKISYSFYLVHLEATGWFVLLLRDSVKNVILLGIAAVLFAILFATGFYYLFEKPAFDLSKRIRYAPKKTGLPQPLSATS